MRISISGSQCSGKTTTLNVLKEDEFFSGYEFDLESKTREVEKYNLGHSREANDYTQTIIFSNMIKNSLSIKNKNQCLTDRCILDNLVYSKYLVDKNLISKDLFNVISKSTDDLILNFDVVFVLEPTIKLISNDYRDIDENYRQDIARIFSYYQKHYTIKNRDEKTGKVVIVTPTDLNERVEFIKKYITENTRG
jgi:nicotinamide riboside kinase